MNKQEIEELIKQLKEGLKRANPNATDKEIEKMIMDIFFNAFVSGTMDRDDLKTLSAALGYEVIDEVLDEVEKEMKRRK